MSGWVAYRRIHNHKPVLVITAIDRCYSTIQLQAPNLRRRARGWWTATGWRSGDDRCSGRDTVKVLSNGSQRKSDEAPSHREREYTRAALPVCWRPKHRDHFSQTVQQTLFEWSNFFPYKQKLCFIDSLYLRQVLNF